MSFSISLSGFLFDPDSYSEYLCNTHIYTYDMLYGAMHSVAEFEGEPWKGTLPMIERYLVRSVNLRLTHCL